MLRGLNPILLPGPLYIMRAMGHGDDIVIAEANFPAESMGRQVVRLDGLSATDLLEAVLSVMRLDSFVDDPATPMQVVNDPWATPPVITAFQETIEGAGDNPVPITSIERFTF